MINKAAIAAVLLVAATPLAAQVTGGSLAIEYDFPTEGGDLGGTTYSGAIEYALTRDYAISLDLSGYRLDNIDNTASSFTVHGIYHLDEQTSFGVFAGSDQLDGEDAETLFGLEAGTEFGDGDVAAYAGQRSGDEDNTILFGIDGQYDFANGFAAIGSADFATQDDDSRSRFALGAQYAIMGGPEFYAEIGSVSQEIAGIEDDQTFIGLGARVAFGAERGTTFDQRSLYEVQPGY